MAWRRPGNKPLPEPMLVSILTHICVTWPKWINTLKPKKWPTQCRWHFEMQLKNFSMLNRVSLKFVFEVPLTLSRHNGPLARYVKLRVAHAPGMSGKFSPPPRVSDSRGQYVDAFINASWTTICRLTKIERWVPIAEFYWPEIQIMDSRDKIINNLQSQNSIFARILTN